MVKTVPDMNGCKTLLEEVCRDRNKTHRTHPDLIVVDSTINTTPRSRGLEEKFLGLMNILFCGGGFWGEKGRGYIEDSMLTHLPKREDVPCMYSANAKMELQQYYWQ